MRLARALCTAPTLIHTAPGATLSISGRCAALVVKTNSETDFAHASATVAGAPCELARAGALVSDANGDISLAASNADAAIMVEVPAVFDVAVAVEGACDVEVRGWLEGRVDVSTGRGRVQVGTVRGLLTRLQTEAGDVSVDHVEGNLLVETGAGDVALGRYWARSCAPRRAPAASRRAVCQAGQLLRQRPRRRPLGRARRRERRRLRAPSVDGACDVALGPAASLELQAGELLRSRVVGDGDGDGGAGAPAIELHLPELHARGTLRSAAVTLDDAKLATRPLADGDDDYGRRPPPPPPRRPTARRPARRRSAPPPPPRAPTPPTPRWRAPPRAAGRARAARRLGGGRRHARLRDRRGGAAAHGRPQLQDFFRAVQAGLSAVFN